MNSTKQLVDALSDGIDNIIDLFDTRCDWQVRKAICTHCYIESVRPALQLLGLEELCLLHDTGSDQDDTEYLMQSLRALRAKLPSRARKY